VGETVPGAVLAQEFWGRAMPRQPLHHRVPFYPSSETEKIRTPCRPTFEITRAKLNTEWAQVRAWNNIK